MKTTTAAMEEKLSSGAALLVERYNTFFSNPDDIESNHKLRVSIRTLRSLLDFLRPWMSRKQVKLVQSNLKTVVKNTSRLRELDVFTTLATELDPVSHELVAFCEAEAAAERAQVLRVLSDKRMTDLMNVAVEQLQHPAWKASVVESGLDPAFARNRFDALVDGLNADLDALDVNDYESMHDIRKRAKQARYVAEQFSDVIGDDTVAIAKKMKSRQDDLGDLCDARVNRELVSEYLVRPDMTDSLARELVRLI